jgi:hypothetical protein
MSYKFDAGYVENLDIVDGRGFDNTLNNLVGAVNGGLDRENLPADCIVPTQIVSKNVAICNVNRLNYEESTTAATVSSYWNAFAFSTRGNNLCGIRYSDMQGGQTEVEAAVSNIDTEEGMLQITWKCAQWINSHLTNFNAGGGSPASVYSVKSVKWQIKVDGNVVARSRSYFMNWSNVKIECAVPVSKGNHEVRVEYDFVNATDRDFAILYSNTPVFHWFGGTIFTTNRFR